MSVGASPSEGRCYVCRTAKSDDPASMICGADRADLATRPCATPTCESPAGFGRSGGLCEEHAAFLADFAVREGLLRRAKAAKIEQQREEAVAVAAEVPKLAEAFAQAVHAAGAEITRSDALERAGLTGHPAAREIIQHARDHRYVKVEAGRPFTAGAVLPPTPRVPRRDRALKLAHAVHASGHLTREQAAAAAGVTPAGVGRVVALAKDNGWIAGRSGSQGGGMVPGEVAPPEAIAA